MNSADIHVQSDKKCNEPRFHLNESGRFISFSQAQFRDAHAEAIKFHDPPLQSGNDEIASLHLSIPKQEDV